MFQESRSKVKQSHGAKHALTSGRSGRKIALSLLVIPALAFTGSAGWGATRPNNQIHRPAAVSYIHPPRMAVVLPRAGIPKHELAEDHVHLARAAAVVRLKLALRLNHIREAKVAAWLRAVARARIPYDFGLWVRVHNCEQPDTWHAGGHFGNGLPAGGNGLGFSAGAWQMGVDMAARRGVMLPASGWLATIDQQMQLAQAVLDATGGGPDCLMTVR